MDYSWENAIFATQDFDSIGTSKKVREVNPIRPGLRKRKRAESPVQTDPQVSEEWIYESKLDLWGIKQYGDEEDKVNHAFKELSEIKEVRRIY